MPLRLTKTEVIERTALLPAFPRVIRGVLDSLDDENASTSGLVHLLQQDPVIAGRVIALASSAAVSMRPGAAVHGLAGATSMIGLAKVREIVLNVGVAEFARDSQMSSCFWEHSAAVGVAAQELARNSHLSLDYALIAGLLHDIGQLWIARFYPLEFKAVHELVAAGEISIIKAEQSYFGADHCWIGSVIAEHWGLPAAVVAAINFHHQPEEGLSETLVSVVHVAEVLSNALDLTQRRDNQVAYLSAPACEVLGLDWDSDMNFLFAKIEARTEHACAVFRH
ncbi:MAG: HDOD domain-containing protein [Azonexus sp.]|nr:HDOD domain-containing protein [Azonexus sp.]